MQLNFILLKEVFTIHRFDPGSTIPVQILQRDFLSITKTRDELSIVCPALLDISSQKKETNWRCFKVAGTLDFSQTGILAEISNVLAANQISIFALSTFDTDYFLVKSDALQAAKSALRKAGHCLE
jgi:hypothetical protein